MTRPPCPACGRPMASVFEDPMSEEHCGVRGSSLCRVAAAGKRAAQQWRPMSEAPKDAPIQILQRYGTGYIAESAEWNEYAWVTTRGSILPEYRCLGYMLFPEPPKEGT